MRNAVLNELYEKHENSIGLVEPVFPQKEGWFSALNDEQRNFIDCVRNWMVSQNSRGGTPM
jgi:hypothetical protein